MDGGFQQGTSGSRARVRSLPSCSVEGGAGVGRAGVREDGEVKIAGFEVAFRNNRIC